MSTQELKGTLCFTINADCHFVRLIGRNGVKLDIPRGAMPEAVNLPVPLYHDGKLIGEMSRRPHRTGYRNEYRLAIQADGWRITRSDLIERDA